MSNSTCTTHKSIVNYNIIKSILLISNIFNLPSDISENICQHILYISAQKIINNWYRHISIHSSNLVNLVCKLRINNGFYQHSNIYYYNLHDINVLRTFRICYKMIDLNISCHVWWSDIFRIACNGRYFKDESLDTDIFYQSLNIITLFHNKSRDYIKKLCNSIVNH